MIINKKLWQLRETLKELAEWKHWAKESLSAFNESLNEPQLPRRLSKENFQRVLAGTTRIREAAKVINDELEKIHREIRQLHDI
jgi:hypothetical protein